MPFPRFTPLALIAVLGSLLSACEATPSAPPPDLAGSHWQLQQIGADAVLPQPVATLGFLQAGQVAGHGSCNRFFGSVEVKPDGRLRMGPLAATKMACLGPEGAQEQRYLGALEKAQRYEVQGDVLLVHTEGLAQPLRFTRSTPPK